MIERLIRIGLALAVAIVFTGRMEAAATHCAKIAATEAAAEAPQPEAMPCHGMDEAAPSPQQGSHHTAPHNPAQKTCECVAVLTGYASVAAAIASARIEPYEWMRSQATAFTSIEPSPDRRPPRT
jgi:hypothetical protein